MHLSTAEVEVLFLQKGECVSMVSDGSETTSTVVVVSVILRGEMSVFARGLEYSMRYVTRWIEFVYLS